MKCAKCGKKLKSNEKFCTYCGYYNDATEEENEIIEDQEDSIDDNWYDDDEITPNEEEEEIVLEPVKEEKKKKEKKPKKEKPVKVKEEPKPVEKIVEVPVEIPVEKPKKEKKEKPVKEIKIKEDNEIYDQNERYIEAYIGEDYKLIKKSPFNIWAFLLNWMYFLYRKLYITGIIGLVITAVVAVFLTKYFLIYAIVTLIILGIGFNPYYVFITKSKVNKILKEYEGSDSFTLENTCKELGGVNVAMALIIYFIFLAVVLISILKPTVNTNHNTKFFKENSENEANCTSLIKLAYSSEKSNYSKIKEAVCKINKNSKTYQIYFKANKDNKNIYIFYETENEYLVYRNNTESLERMEEKKNTQSITEEEDKYIRDAKAIVTNYESIRKKSLEEDKLIETKKDKEEKVNYIFDYELLIR